MLVCTACHKPYTPPAELEVSYCPYCGVENKADAGAMQSAAGPAFYHSLDPAERLAMAAQTGNQRLIALLEQRYKPVVRKKRQSYSDCFLPFWLRLKFFTLNPGLRNDKLAKKEIPAFFEALEEFPSELVEGELYNSAIVYLSTCARDLGYSTLVLGMFKTKSEDSINHIAYEMVSISRDTLDRLGLSGRYPQVFRAALSAFRDFFPEHTELIDKRIGQEAH